MSEALPQMSPALGRMQTSAGLVLPANSPVLRFHPSQVHEVDRALARIHAGDGDMDDFDLDVMLGVKTSDGTIIHERILESPTSSWEGTPTSAEARAREIASSDTVRPSPPPSPALNRPSKSSMATSFGRGGSRPPRSPAMRQSKSGVRSAAPPRPPGAALHRSDSIRRAAAASAERRRHRGAPREGAGVAGGAAAPRMRAVVDEATALHGAAAPAAGGRRPRASVEEPLLDAARAPLAADSWSGFHLERCETELATERTYDARRETWVEAPVLVKMQRKPFARGAMRQCYRAKKRQLTEDDFFHVRKVSIGIGLRGFGAKSARRLAAKLRIRDNVGSLLDAVRDRRSEALSAIDGLLYSSTQKESVYRSLDNLVAAAAEDEARWAREPNFVTKNYIEPDAASDEVFLEDTKLQMVAKLWAEEFNSFNPPKKVDIVRTTLLRLEHRAGAPLMAAECLIVGDYVKYNTNAGGLIDDIHRETPQTFSHFTFERSAHQLMVVDVQGVGDLYTDPQLHSADGLRQFRLEPSEIGHITDDRKQREHALAASRDAVEQDRAEDAAPRSGLSIDVPSHGGAPEAGLTPTFEPGMARTHSASARPERDVSEGGTGSRRLRSLVRHATVVRMVDPYHVPQRTALDGETAAVAAARAAARRRADAAKLRHARLADRHPDEDVGLQRYGIVHTKAVAQQRAVLRSAVHYDLAVCHAIGRVSYGRDEPPPPNAEAMRWHLRRAAEDFEAAQLTLAQLYDGNEVEPFPAGLVSVDRAKAFGYRLKAAQRGTNRDAMVRVANSLASGDTPGVAPSFKHAVMWYERAVACDDGVPDAVRGVMESPNYKLLQAAAKLCAEGGNDLERDISRAVELYEAASEAAMARGAGQAAMACSMAADELRGAE